MKSERKKEAKQRLTSKLPTFQASELPIYFLPFTAKIKIMKRYLFWIVELFIWILVLSALAGTIIVVKSNYKKFFNTYQIFLPDVDGLIKGSPVKIMGINIGYVKQINIVGEDVYVKFIITTPNVRIPHGSKATVEFSGLGGSKSLEIYPPKSDKDIISEKFIITESPKRIHDSLGLLSDMYDQFMEITYTVSIFMDKIGIIKRDQKIKESPQAFINKLLDSSNAGLDKIQQKSDKITDKLNLQKGGKNERRQN